MVKYPDLVLTIRDGTEREEAHPALRVPFSRAFEKAKHDPPPEFKAFLNKYEVSTTGSDHPLRLMSTFVNLFLIENTSLQYEYR